MTSCTRGDAQMPSRLLGGILTPSRRTDRGGGPAHAQARRRLAKSDGEQEPAAGLEHKHNGMHTGTMGKYTGGRANKSTTARIRAQGENTPAAGLPRAQQQAQA